MKKNRDCAGQRKRRKKRREGGRGEENKPTSHPLPRNASIVILDIEG